MKYLMDSNAYIEAKNAYYDMSFCPAFWQWLDHQFELGQLGSIVEVYAELAGYGDELSDWVKDRKIHFLSVDDEQTQSKYVEVLEYVYGLEGKSQANVNNFMDKADPWIIAKAAVLNATIVTHERLDPPNSKKVKIPNVCQQFGVNYINTFELLRHLNAKFQLAV